ncbi:hypothetical protein D9M71_746270 [compost metagenome]
MRQKKTSSRGQKIKTTVITRNTEIQTTRLFHFSSGAEKSATKKKNNETETMLAIEKNINGIASQNIANNSPNLAFQVIA